VAARVKNKKNGAKGGINEKTANRDGSKYFARKTAIPEREAITAKEM